MFDIFIFILLLSFFMAVDHYISNRFFADTDRVKKENEGFKKVEDKVNSWKKKMFGD